MHTVEINGLSEPTETAVVNENYQPVSGEIDLEAAWAAYESVECDSDEEC